MIGKHYGQSVIPLNDNPVYFRVRCNVCGRVFKQRKRRKAPLKPKEAKP